jgi:hypothetical protein
MDITWADGRLAEATIHSLQGNMCRIAGEEVAMVACDGTLVIVQRDDGGCAFATEAGKVYHVKAG